MKIETYQSIPGDPRWRELFASSGENNYFATERWYENFLATVATDPNTIQLVGATSPEGIPVAMFPLWQPGRSGWFTPDQVEGLANYYTCLYEPLLHPDQAVAADGVRAIADHLRMNARNWEVLDLKPMPEDAWYIEVLKESFESPSFSTSFYLASGNWYLDAAELDFDAYFMSRRKKMRSTVRSKTKQLQEQFALDIRIVTGADEVASGIAEYDEVYSKSWKQPEPHLNFIPGLAASLAQQGKLRLGLLTLNAKPAAAQLWFVHGDSAYIYKLAYDPEFSKFSVGTLLTMKIMEHVLGVDGVKVVDFLSGDDDYKSQWMSHRRQRIGLEVISLRSPRGILLHGRRLAGRLKKRLMATRRGIPAL